MDHAEITARVNTHVRELQELMATIALSNHCEDPTDPIGDETADLCVAEAHVTRFKEVLALVYSGLIFSAGTRRQRTAR